MNALNFDSYSEHIFHILYIIPLRKIIKELDLKFRIITTFKTLTDPTDPADAQQMAKKLI